MKFNFLKFKRDNKPSLESLRPKIFDTNLFWFLTLGLCLIVFIITFAVGLKLFYSQYFESYKKNKPVENSESIINMSKLKSAIEKRNNIINKEIPLLVNPSP